MHIWPYAVKALLLGAGWLGKTIWDWWAHCFLLGFKATLAASIKKGSKLTPEEAAEVQVKVKQKIVDELQAKLKIE